MNLAKNLCSTLVIASAMAIGFSSCEEQLPPLEFSENRLLDTVFVEVTTEAAQPKLIVMEEFSGVRCTNCPQGHALSADLTAQYAGRFMSITLHSDFLAEPYSFSPQDLRPIFQNLNKAEEINSWLGPAPAKPSAIIDRKQFPGENSLIYLTQKWSGFVDQQLSQSSPVNIDLQVNNLDLVEGSGELSLRIYYHASVNSPNKVTVGLLENGIVSPQLDGAVIDTNYVHEEVLRNYVTPIRGEDVKAVDGSDDKGVGTTILREYKFKLNSNWKPEKMYAFAFVHEFGTSDRIVQGAHIELVD